MLAKLYCDIHEETRAFGDFARPSSPSGNGIHRKSLTRFCRFPYHHHLSVPIPMKSDTSSSLAHQKLNSQKTFSHEYFSHHNSPFEAQLSSMISFSVSSLKFICVLIFLDTKGVSSYSTKSHHFTRRRCIQIACASFVANSNALISNAKVKTTINPLENLLEAQGTLNTLLTNYKRATIDCTFAEVPRELLETKNKELLLEKAATNALFDKSASIETCKTTNRIVRDYLGVTGKGMFEAASMLIIITL